MAKNKPHIPRPYLGLSTRSLELVLPTVMSSLLLSRPYNLQRGAALLLGRAGFYRTCSVFLKGSYQDFGRSGVG